MDKKFYNFRLFDKTGSIYLNKDNIIAFNQHGVGNGITIKMVNSDIFKVDHTVEQVLSILGEKIETN